jgi:hypothetical protein
MQEGCVQLQADKRLAAFRFFYCGRFASHFWGALGQRQRAVALCDPLPGPMTLLSHTYAKNQ